MSFIKLQQGIIYGPIRSKRLGRSLGINLLPMDKKVCSFNCIYCHYGPTIIKTVNPEGIHFPSIEEVIKEVERVLKNDKEFDYLTFSGNGEPMLHPDFSTIVEEIKSLRDKYRPGIPIALLTNSSLTSDKEKLKAALLVDFPVFKLDCGDSITFRKVNDPHPTIEIGEIINTLSSLKEITLQTLLLGGRVENYRGKAFKNWLEAVNLIKPRKIQLYSLDFDILGYGLKRIEDSEISALASTVQQRLQISTTPYWEKD